VSGRVVEPVRRSLSSRLSRIALLAGASVLLAGCSTNGIENKLRFGWPSGVTKQGERMRSLWTWSSVAALVVGVIVWFLIFWCCIRYRKRDDQLPRQTKYHLPIEIAYTIAPFFVIGVLFWYTAVDENYVDKLSAHPDTTVTVEAFKWGWAFHYDNMPWSSTDPASKSPNALYRDVYTTGTSTEVPVLVIPSGETVRFVEHSDDVIHSFWVPEFLFKRDVIPQKVDNQFEITATKDGSYVGRCAELCGTYHSQMNFEVRVVPPAEYTKYMATLQSIGSQDSNLQAKALVAIGGQPYATVTHPFNTDRSVLSASYGS
jgi:cytochrome c oxidase subunit 2